MAADSASAAPFRESAAGDVRFTATTSGALDAPATRANARLFPASSGVASVAALVEVPRVTDESETKPVSFTTNADAGFVPPT